MHLACVLVGFTFSSLISTTHPCSVPLDHRMEDQFSDLHNNPDILIATPGRFMHVIVEMGLTLSTVEYIVFDEADRHVPLICRNVTFLILA